MVECLCLAPFSPPGEIIVPEYRDAFKEHPEHYIWDFPPVKNADEWGCSWNTKFIHRAQWTMRSWCWTNKQGGKGLWRGLRAIPTSQLTCGNFA